MIPARVPPELNGLTQVEEMLIARALPIMRVYVKPGGKCAYHDHCINLTQDVSDLASHYRKDISVIVVKTKDKDNSTRDVTARRLKGENALNWLINHNPHYQCVTINANALDNLAVNGVPADILTVEIYQDTSTDVELPEPDIGPLSEEDLIYNSESEMSSFLPVPQLKCQEIDAIRDMFSEASQPLNFWERPRLHPCQRKYEDIDAMNTDYVDFLNTCQRHTQCSTQYCLKQKSNESEQTCRLKLLFQLCSNTRLEFEQINLKRQSSQIQGEVRYQEE